MSKRNKQKSKQRAKGPRSSGSPLGWFRPRQPDPAQFAMQAGTLLEAGKADEALDLLEPLLDDYPRSVELFATAAVAYIQVGDLWSAIACFEQVQKFRADSIVWATLATLYLQAGMNFYAMQAARNALKGVGDSEEKSAMRMMLAPLEDEFDQLVQSLGIAAKQVENGLRHHDDAQRAMSQFDLQAAIDANRRAIRFLGNWPPVHNNLAQTLYFSGQPAEAIATTQKVLADAPDNLHALSNGIKFLAWSGKTDEADSLWERLRPLEPKNETERFKQAEAAAILEEDESVYRILKPLVDAGLQHDSPLEWQTLYFFTIAEANTGRTKSALKHLKELGESDLRVKAVAKALKAKRPGLGWSTRYPYFSLNEIMTLSNLEEVAALIAQQEELPEEQSRSRIRRVIQRFPQLTLIGKKFIWEEMQPDFGITLLDMLGTPEAHALLRDFGFSQAGSDQDRMDALIRLKEAGVLNADEPVRMWSGGEWREVKLISYEISDEPEVVYSPQAIKLYERALDAYHHDNYAEAERLLKQVIALEPEAADAYFNLGAAYAAQGNREQAEKMCRKAIELRPLYAMPRCHLAQLFLADGDVEKAKEILLPLADATRLSTIDVTMYMYVQARILIDEKDYEKAESLLESLVEVAPDFTPAQKLLENVGIMTLIGTGYEGILGRMRLRAENRRAAMQTKLKTTDVPVDMALGVFNREVQGSMARHILIGGGWSALKKKELHERLAITLPERYTLEHIVSNLNSEERTVLRAVLAKGGVMTWDEFDQAYGNDLDESPDWQYHEPTTLMGRLRQRALLSVATVGKRTLVVVPIELRKPLAELL